MAPHFTNWWALMKFDKMLIFIRCIVCSTAPGAPPPDVTAKAVSYDTIQVAWGELPCVEHNGLITGYVVQVSLDGEVVSTTDSVGSSTATTLTSLLPLRTYSVSVAAATEQGIGPHSSPVAVTTPLTSMCYESNISSFILFCQLPLMHSSWTGRLPGSFCYQCNCYQCLVEYSRHAGTTDRLLPPSV